jgi:hypothetical protein
LQRPTTRAVGARHCPPERGPAWPIPSGVLGGNWRFGPLGAEGTPGLLQDKMRLLTLGESICITKWLERQPKRARIGYEDRCHTPVIAYVGVCVVRIALPPRYRAINLSKRWMTSVVIVMASG